MLKKLFFILCFPFLLGSCTSQDIGAYIVKVESKQNLHTLANSIKNTSASGIIFGKNTILTVAHGVGNTQTSYTIDNNSAAILLKKYEETDIAFLKTSKQLNSLPQLAIGTPKAKEKVVSYSTLGKKEGSILTLSKNEFFVTMKFQTGESGGGIFNERKELIGIIGAYDFEKDRGVGYRIKKE